MYYKAMLLLSIILNVSAQLILKFGMKNVNVDMLQTNTVYQKITNTLNPWFFGAMLFYGASFFIYAVVLSKMEVSRAYPISVVTAMILLLLFSVLFLNESMTLSKVAGIILCTGGILLILN